MLVILGRLGRAIGKVRRVGQIGAAAVAKSWSKIRADADLTRQIFYYRSLGVSPSSLFERSRQRMASIARLCSLMGQGGGSVRAVAPVGCLRSLRAHLALDGVSSVQSASVKITVGQLAACHRIDAVICSLGRRDTRDG